MQYFQQSRWKELEDLYRDVLKEDEPDARRAFRRSPPRLGANVPDRREVVQAVALALSPGRSRISSRPLTMRFVAAGVVLLGLLSLLTAKGAQVQDRDSRPASLEVILLLDRSPSANAKTVSGRPLIEDRAHKLLNQIYSLCQFYGVGLRYGAANFGGKLGNDTASQLTFQLMLT